MAARGDGALRGRGSRGAGSVVPLVDGDAHAITVALRILTLIGCEVVARSVSRDVMDDAVALGVAGGKLAGAEQGGVAGSAGRLAGVGDERAGAGDALRNGTRRRRLGRIAAGVVGNVGIHAAAVLANRLMALIRDWTEMVNRRLRSSEKE